MNKSKLILSIAFAFLTCLSLNAGVSLKTYDNPKVIHEHTKTETFKVYGNCGMCKKTIESALQDQKGMSSAEWNKETKMMTVAFNEHEINLKEIVLYF